MILVNHHRDGIRRHTSGALLESAHYLLNSRPFAWHDHHQMLAPRSRGGQTEGRL